MRRYLVTNRGRLIVGDALNHYALIVRCGLELADIHGGGECHTLGDTVYLCDGEPAEYLEYIVATTGVFDTSGNQLADDTNFII